MPSSLVSKAFNCFLKVASLVIDLRLSGSAFQSLLAWLDQVRVDSRVLPAELRRAVRRGHGVGVTLRPRDRDDNDDDDDE